MQPSDQPPQILRGQAVAPGDVPPSGSHVAMLSGLVGNIQRYSLHDGPGIRTTVFLKGCALSCLWCHNPENRASHPEILTLESRCMRCGACAEVCPSGSLPNFGKTGQEGEEPCRLCGACVEACPTGARQVVGKPMTVNAVMAEIRKDAIFYEDSGGGVTFSGGEPLAQPEFLQALVEACAARGIATAIDTCGFAPWERLLAASAAADLVLYDLKSIDDSRHTRFTGVSNCLILDNLRALGRVHGNIWLRIPIIPGLNDADEELDAMARFAASVGGVRQINLLPYHRRAIAKFQRMGQTYELAGVAPPSSERMQSILNRFTTLGLTAKVGG